MRAYFGHHKCGSTWVWQLVSGVCREAGLGHYLVLAERTAEGRGPLIGYRLRNREGPAAGSFERALLRERAEAAGADVVSCLAADREQLDALRPERAFHVIRDPRDIVVSAYFSHRNSHPTDGLPLLAEHRERLRAVPKEEGLLLEMDFSRADLLAMAEWDYDRPNVLEVRLEELAASPYDGFVRIFRHLGLLGDDEPTKGRVLASFWLRRTLNRLATRPGFGLLRRPIPVTGELLLGAVYANRFEAKTKGRPVGAEDPRSHYRKGAAGDWINHFTPDHVHAFEERFEGLPDKLGYGSLVEAARSY
jgi:hypothetical protein